MGGGALKGERTSFTTATPREPEVWTFVIFHLRVKRILIFALTVANIKMVALRYDSLNIFLQYCGTNVVSPRIY